MKSTHILLFLGLSSCFAACKKDQFSYDLYKPSVGEIDSIAFSASSKTLIADGKASISFVVETFRKTKMENSSGQQVDTMLRVDPELLPEGAVQLFANGQLLNSESFSTKDLQQGAVTFQAKVGALTSGNRVVSLRQPQLLPQAKTIPLVFHVLELDPKDAAYNTLTYLNIDPKILQKTVDKLNDVFNNRYGNDPNGGSMDVQFTLATTNATGGKLTYPGYNKVIYNNSWKAFATATSYTPTDFKTKINSLANMKWDPKKFVNIYIIPLPANTGVGTNAPTYQLQVANETAIPGVTNIVNSENEVVATDFYETYGLGVHRNLFTLGADQPAEIASYLGKYYGLKSTNLKTITDTDYCSDTRKYIAGPTEVLNLIKTGIDGFKFVANNAMDDVRYPSLRNCFTVDQINRMQDVLKRSPVRQAYSTKP